MKKIKLNILRRELLRKHTMHALIPKIVCINIMIIFTKNT